MTDQLSKVKVRFPEKIDQVGSIVFSALVGWVMVCFTLTTLHTAPLGKKFFFGCFQAGKPMFLGFVSPDLQWLSFVQHTSKGGLCRSVNDGGNRIRRFRSRAEFLEKYNVRRKGGTHVNKFQHRPPERTREAGRFTEPPDAPPAGNKGAPPPPAVELPPCQHC